jgi:hypothetical protein
MAARSLKPTHWRQVASRVVYQHTLRKGMNQRLLATIVAETF